MIVSQIWLACPWYGRLMMLAKLVNIGITGMWEEEYKTWLTIQVQNS
jgi:hypothetical protein